MLLFSSFLWAEWEVADVCLIFPHDIIAGIGGVSELHPNPCLPHREQPVLCLLCEGTVWEQCVYFPSPSFFFKGATNLIDDVCCCPVAQLCLTLCDPMDYSKPGFPVLQYLSEFAQTHVHWVTDAIQPSHPLLPPFPPALNLSQHQSLFQ